MIPFFLLLNWKPPNQIRGEKTSQSVVFNTLMFRDWVDQLSLHAYTEKPDIILCGNKVGQVMSSSWWGGAGRGGGRVIWNYGWRTIPLFLYSSPIHSEKVDYEYIKYLINKYNIYHNKYIYNWFYFKGGMLFPKKCSIH